jgi:hypothetical protein
MICKRASEKRRATGHFSPAQNARPSTFLFILLHTVPPRLGIELSFWNAARKPRVSQLAVPKTPNDNATVLGVPQLQDSDLTAPHHGDNPNYGEVHALRTTAVGFPAPAWHGGKHGGEAVKPAAPASREPLGHQPHVAEPACSGEVAALRGAPPKPRVPPKPHIQPHRPQQVSSVPGADAVSNAPFSSGPPVNANWRELYEQLGSAEKRRALRELQRKADQQALAEYERWAKRSIVEVMEDLAQAARLRAAELLEATGKQLDVEYPSGPTVVGASGDAEIRFLKLSLGKGCVHVYSSHARGSTTHIHLLPAFTDSLKKNHRLVSEPGAFVVRRSDDRYELRYFRGDPAATNEAMTVDLLLYKALRLLVRCAEDE